MARESRAQIAFEAQGSGRFATVPAGRDGRISGFVFFDHDANGLMGAAESGRYAGMTVTLVSATGDEVESCRTALSGFHAAKTAGSGWASRWRSTGQMWVQWPHWMQASVTVG